MTVDAHLSLSVTASNMHARREFSNIGVERLHVFMRKEDQPVSKRDPRSERGTRERTREVTD